MVPAPRSLKATEEKAAVNPMSHENLKVIKFEHKESCKSSEN